MRNQFAKNISSSLLSPRYKPHWPPTLLPSLVMLRTNVSCSSNFSTSDQSDNCPWKLYSCPDLSSDFSPVSAVSVSGPALMITMCRDHRDAAWNSQPAWSRESDPPQEARQQRDRGSRTRRGRRGRGPGTCPLATS